MGWRDILKNVITQGKIKEIEDIDIDIEDDDCNRKLQQLVNKLKNTKLLLEQTWDRGWDEDKYSQHPDVQDMAIPFDRDAVLVEERNKKPESRNFSIKDKKSDITILSESLFYTYNPVPEEVACKALEMLRLERTEDYQMEVGGRMYGIHRFYDEDASLTEYYEVEMFNAINISVGGKRLEDGYTYGGETLVVIEWSASVLEKSRIGLSGDIYSDDNFYYSDYARILSEWDKTGEYGLTWHK